MGEQANNLHQPICFQKFVAASLGTRTDVYCTATGGRDAEAHCLGAVDSSSWMGNCITSICVIEIVLYATCVVILCASDCRGVGNIEFDLLETYLTM